MAPDGRPIGPGGVPLGPDGRPYPVGPDGRPLGPDGQPLPIGPDGRPLGPDGRPIGPGEGTRPYGPGYGPSSPGFSYGNGTGGPGVIIDPITGKPIEIDECELMGHMMCKNGKCINTMGSFMCECNPGFRYDDPSHMCVGE